MLSPMLVMMSSGTSGQLSLTTWATQSDTALPTRLESAPLGRLWLRVNGLHVPISSGTVNGVALRSWRASPLGSPTGFAFSKDERHLVWPPPEFGLFNDASPTILRCANLGVSHTSISDFFKITIWSALVLAGINKGCQSDHLHRQRCACGRTNTDEDAQHYSARVSAKDG